jgi:hypothetical protein
VYYVLYLGTSLFFCQSGLLLDGAVRVSHYDFVINKLSNPGDKFAIVVCQLEIIIYLSVKLVS